MDSAAEGWDDDGGWDDAGDDGWGGKSLKKMKIFHDNICNRNNILLYFVTCYATRVRGELMQITIVEAAFYCYH